MQASHESFCIGVRRGGTGVQARAWVVTAVGGRQLVSQGRTGGFEDVRRGGAGDDTRLGQDYCGPIASFPKQWSIRRNFRPVTRVKQVDPS